MTVREVVSKISGIDTISIYKNGEPVCNVHKKDLDNDLPFLDSEVCNMDFSVWDLWVDEPISELVLNIK